MQQRMNGMFVNETGNDGVEDRLRPYMQLWTNVVIQAIKDACDKPMVATDKNGKAIRENGREVRTVTPLARKAMEWMFVDEHAKYVYETLNLDRGSFEARLVGAFNKDGIEDSYFDRFIPPEKRRCFKFNYTAYKAASTKGTTATYPHPTMRGVQEVDIESQE